jgi:hypothetical protein
MHIMQNMTAASDQGGLNGAPGPDAQPKCPPHGVTAEQSNISKTYWT